MIIVLKPLGWGKHSSNDRGVEASNRGSEWNLSILFPMFIQDQETLGQQNIHLDLSISQLGSPCPHLHLYPRKHGHETMMYFTSLGGCMQCANTFSVTCLSWTSLPAVLPCPPQRWLPGILKMTGFSRLCWHKLLINEVHRSVMVRHFLLEFIGLPEHSCLITACTAVYALINQRSFAEMGWITMNLPVGIFPLQAQMMEQSRPIWLLCKRTRSGKLFSQPSQGSLEVAGVRAQRGLWVTVWNEAIYRPLSLWL